MKSLTNFITVNQDYIEPREHPDGLGVSDSILRIASEVIRNECQLVARCPSDVDPKGLCFGVLKGRRAVTVISRFSRTDNGAKNNT